MKQIACVLLVIGLLLFSTGCSIKHVVANDYPQYLVNNAGSTQFPHTEYTAQYILTPNTISHRLKFRAASTGLAHLWIVDFGKILEDTLESNDIQSAFKKLQKASGSGDLSGLVIKYNLIAYRFAGFEATVNLQVTVTKDGAVIMDKTYLEKGLGQRGKVALTGVFGMKNAIQQSTKLAVDKILLQSLNDMKLIIDR
ncbi:MAG: hypothetical protein HY806_07430 [Nitrospirae bacterium]|nr:hypothetical protein [Nitrospirota bacterium]MBI4838954.1 hypothetical protein [Nitrospirota bacterium]